MIDPTNEQVDAMDAMARFYLECILFSFGAFAAVGIVRHLFF